MELWCLDAAFTFQKIENLLPHSIIMTSGTMSPLSEFEAEMGIDFPFKYSGKHVIDD